MIHRLIQVHLAARKFLSGTYNTSHVNHRGTAPCTPKIIEQLSGRGAAMLYAKWWLPGVVVGQRLYYALILGNASGNWVSVNDDLCWRYTGLYWCIDYWLVSVSVMVCAVADLSLVIWLVLVSVVLVSVVLVSVVIGMVCWLPCVAIVPSVRRSGQK